MKKLLAVLLLLVVPAAFAGVEIVRGNLTQIFGVSVSLTPANVAANTSAEQGFTVNGVKSGDVVIANKPTAQAGLAIGNVRVSGTDSVAIVFVNATGSTITPTSESWIFTILRPQDQPLPSRVSP